MSKRYYAGGRISVSFTQKEIQRLEKVIARKKKKENEDENKRSRKVSSASYS